MKSLNTLVLILSSTLVPHAQASFFMNSREQNHRMVSDSSQASEQVYDIHDDFVEHPENFEEVKGLPGFFVPQSSLKTFSSDYSLEAIFCAQQFIQSQECGLFVALYSPNSAEILPILAIKGTTSLNDWKHNLLNRGTFFISWMFELMRSQVSSKKYREQEQLRRILTRLRVFLGNEAILTGHSLGGGLAQALALAFSNEFFEEDPPLLNVITYNSLAGESLLVRLVKSPEALLRDGADLVLWGLLEPSQVDFDLTRNKKLPSNVFAMSISTQDDILQGVNKILRKKNLGVSLRIPTKRNLQHRSSIDSLLGGVNGHGMKIVLKDIEFLYSGDDSKQWLIKEQEYWSSDKAIRANTRATKDLINDFGLDEDSWIDMSLVARRQDLPKIRVNHVNRMLHFLSEPAVKHLLGL